MVQCWIEVFTIATEPRQVAKPNREEAPDEAGVRRRTAPHAEGKVANHSCRYRNGANGGSVRHSMLFISFQVCGTYMAYVQSHRI